MKRATEVRLSGHIGRHGVRVCIRPHVSHRYRMTGMLMGFTQQGEHGL